MLKQSLFSLVLVVGMAMSGVAGAQEESDVTAYQTVRGVVSFERHSTLIPLSYCEGETCAGAQPYWAVVIHSDEAEFEINRMYAKGSAEAPESIQLESVVVRPGTQLELEARVSPMTRSRSVITDLRKVNVCMDTAAEASAPLAPVLPVL